jgi:hypothetical protein
MSTRIEIPDGWKTKDFGVALKDGKPEGATAWFDTQGRPVVKVGRTWQLKRQKPAPPRKLSPKPPSPELELTPEEQEVYGTFSALAKEKIAQGTKKSIYPNPEQAQRDEENRKRRFAPYAALSDNQLSAINAYTSKWDLNVNSFLRGGKIKYTLEQRAKTEAAPSESQVKKAAADLTSALEALPSAPEAQYTRAVSGSVWAEDGSERQATEFIKQIQALEPGDMLEDSGFSSFTSAGAPVIDSFLKGDANSDQNVVFSVKSSGMKDISPISRYESEKEHMLPPGAKFRVVGKRSGQSRSVGTYTLIELEHLTEQ